MPAAFFIDPQNKLKFVHISGKTHLHELRSLAEEYFASPQFSDEIRYLVDLSELTDAEAKFRDVFALVGFYKRMLKTLEKPIDVAIFAPSDLGYGISRMFATLMKGGNAMQVRIFSDMSDALQWLDLRHVNVDELKKQVSCDLEKLAR